VIAAALALIVIGILLTLFAVIWVGIPVGIVGVLLLLAYLLGIGRRAAREQRP
jgi:hypothetical protein